MRPERRTRASLRPDTVVRSAGSDDAGVYLARMPGCCLASLKGEVRSGGDRTDGLVCRTCERRWSVLSSLDGRVTEKFLVAREEKRRVG